MAYPHPKGELPSVEYFRDGDAVKILKNGKIIHIQDREAMWGTKFSVIYKDQYFVCRDNYNFADKSAVLHCYGTPDDE